MNICCENTVTVSYDAFMTICFVFVCVVFFVCVVDASTISALVCPSFLHSSVLPKEGTAFAYSLSSALRQQLDLWFLTKRLRLNRVDKGSMTDCSRKGSSARLDTVRLAKKKNTTTTTTAPPVDFCSGGFDGAGDWIWVAEIPPSECCFSAGEEDGGWHTLTAGPPRDHCMHSHSGRGFFFFSN